MINSVLQTIFENLAVIYKSGFYTLDLTSDEKTPVTLINKDQQFPLTKKLFLMDLEEQFYSQIVNERKKELEERINKEFEEQSRRIRPQTDPEYEFKLLLRHFADEKPFKSRKTEKALPDLEIPESLKEYAFTSSLFSELNLTELLFMESQCYRLKSTLKEDKESATKIRIGRKYFKLEKQHSTQEFIRIYMENLNKKIEKSLDGWFKKKQSEIISYFNRLNSGENLSDAYFNQATQKGYKKIDSKFYLYYVIKDYRMLFDLPSGQTICFSMPGCKLAIKITKTRPVRYHDQPFIIDDPSYFHPLVTTHLSSVKEICIGANRNRTEQPQVNDKNEGIVRKMSDVLRLAQGLLEKPQRDGSSFFYIPDPQTHFILKKRIIRC